MEHRSPPLPPLLRRFGPLAGIPLAAPAVAAAAPFLAVAAATRRIHRSLPLQPSVLDGPMVEFAPEVGVRPLRNLDTHGEADDVFRLTTDAEGWRGSATIDDADVIVFGDSFAFGYGVSDEDHFAERVPGARVKPIAAPAYSMVHGLLWMQRLADRLAGKAVVWLVYCGNDLIDNLRPWMATYRMPFVRERGTSWEVVTDHVSPEPWTFRSPTPTNDEVMRELCRDTRVAARAFSAADHLIGRAADTCGAAGASSFSIVSVPITSAIRAREQLTDVDDGGGPVDPAVPDRRLAESCRRHGIPFAAMAPELEPEHYWRRDMHWNAAGHGVAAGAIQRIVAGAPPRG